VQIFPASAFGVAIEHRHACRAAQPRRACPGRHRELLPSEAKRANGDLVNGATFVELVRSALIITVKNRDKLLDLQSADPRSNLMFKTLDVLAGQTGNDCDPRGLLDRQAFVATAMRILRAVSDDLDPTQPTAPRLVADAVAAALQLSTGSLRHRINADNLPRLTEGLVRAALIGELKLTDSKAISTTALELLKVA